MTPLTVLSVHNHYRQPGGEDQVFESEAALLQGRGHRVVRYTEGNDHISTGALTALTATWNHAAYKNLRRVVRDERPQIAHFHNTFPRVSPAAYYASRRERVPVVQTLNNFRLICPGATLMRDGRICEDCAQRKSLLPALAHGCYRGSRAGTAAVAGMIAIHRAAGTWSRAVDVYVAISEFARRKFIEGGLPGDRIIVKSNFVDPDPGFGNADEGYALFAGRLSEEKGIGVLAQAWRKLTDIPLLVAGAGPVNDIDWPQNVRLLGPQTREQLAGLMKRARVLVIPSIWYETGPIVLLEAYACGLPVIASDLGSISERLDHHRTGLLFRPGDPEDLAHHVRWAFDHPDHLAGMRTAARREFELKYTAESNYKRLLEIYELAIENRAMAPDARRPVPNFCP